MSRGSNGDDRDGAWIITTNRWSDAGCYIALPVNPESIEIRHELRAEQGTNKRGKIIYISREHRDGPTGGWNTLFKPFDLQFNFNSGNIIPQFNDEYKTACAKLSMAYSSADDDATRLDLAKRIKASYSLSQRVPSDSQVANYLLGKAHSGITTSQNRPNIPQLYSTKVPIGVQNLYSVIMLAEEPMYYNNKPNKVMVHINTLAFPALTLFGTLTESVHWSESVEEFGSFNMDFTLHVVATYPRFGYGKMDTFFANYQDMLTSTDGSLATAKNVLATRLSGD